MKFIILVSNFSQNFYRFPMFYNFKSLFKRQHFSRHFDRLTQFFKQFFSKKKYNQNNSSLVNNMQYNLFTIFPLSGPFAEFGFEILNCAYVLKNGVGWYNIFFWFIHKACWILLFVSFSYRIRQCVCSSTIRFVPCAFFIY
jgi:hypothetical protein